MRTFKPFSTSTIWRLPDPDKDHMHEGKDKKELIQRVTGYRSQNNLPPIENLGLVIDNYLCSLPDNCGICEDVPSKRGFLEYLRGGIALVQNIMFKNFVSQGEADRRASICKDCRYNFFPDRDTFISWSNSLMEHSVGDRKAADYDKLGTCEICTCPNRAKVWSGESFHLTEEQEAKMNSVGCWQPKAKNQGN